MLILKRFEISIVNICHDKELGNITQFVSHELGDNGPKFILMRQCEFRVGSLLLMRKTLNIHS
jgi:hypothetical protein